MTLQLGDVSNVLDMASMFEGASSFNQNIGGWDVTDANTMASMFKNATSFNQNLEFWDPENVTNYSSMFEGAVLFNQDISKWPVLKGTNMENMFKNATSFNQNLTFWLLTPTSGLPTLTNMFQTSGMVGNTFGLTTPTPLKSQFNQGRPPEALTNANIQAVVNAWIANPSASQFTNQNNHPYYGLISVWNVTQVTNMNSLFANKTTFNNIISAWDVSNVTDMTSMFEGATSFTQNISRWNVTSVTYYGINV